MNRAAQQLGRMAKGKPKTMTAAAIAQRKAAGFKPGTTAAQRSAAMRMVRAGSNGGGK